MKVLITLMASCLLATSGCADKRKPFIEPPAPDDWVIRYTTPETYCVGVFNAPKRGLVGAGLNLWTIHPARINFVKRNVERLDDGAWLPVPADTMVPEGDSEIREMLRIYKATTHQP